MGEVPVKASAGAAFAALARDLQRAGAKDLRRELYKGLQRSARPLRAAVVESAQATLPKGGGRGKRRTRLVDTGETLTNAVSGREHAIKRVQKLRGRTDGARSSVAARVVGAGYRTSVTQRGATARMRFTATERQGRKIDLHSLDQGRLRHPLFGDRKWWYSQAVRPGWFTRPLEAKASDFERELDRAVDKVAEEINRG